MPSNLRDGLRKALVYLVFAIIIHFLGNRPASKRGLRAPHDCFDTSEVDWLAIWSVSENPVPRRVMDSIRFWRAFRGSGHLRACVQFDPLVLREVNPRRAALRTRQGICLAPAASRPRGRSR
jgi:hypothetical protein